MRAFTETGVIAPLAYSSRSVSTFLLAGEVKTKFALSPGLSGHTVFGYEAFLGQTGANLRGYIADSPGSNFTARAGRIESPGFLFGAGMSGMISGVQTSVDYRGSVGTGASCSIARAFRARSASERFTLHQEQKRLFGAAFCFPTAR